MAKEELHMRKIDTKSNPVDLMTKFSIMDDKNKMLKFMNMATVDEKDINATSIHNIVKQQQDYWAKMGKGNIKDVKGQEQDKCKRFWYTHL